MAITFLETLLDTDPFVALESRAVYIAVECCIYRWLGVVPRAGCGNTWCLAYFHLVGQDMNTIYTSLCMVSFSLVFHLSNIIFLVTHSCII